MIKTMHSKLSSSHVADQCEHLRVTGVEHQRDRRGRLDRYDSTRRTSSSLTAHVPSVPRRAAS
jgi:hypothetical protein